MSRASTSDSHSASVPRLSEMEWEILKPLWDKGPMAARDIYREVPENCGWAYKTVKTMLSRLVKKGAIAYDQIGNSYLYRAAYSRSEMTRIATLSFVQRVFDGRLDLLLDCFSEMATEKDLRQLRKELARISKGKTDKSKRSQQTT